MNRLHRAQTQATALRRFRHSKLPHRPGVANAACKNVVRVRLKQSAIYWAVERSNAILEPHTDAD